MNVRARIGARPRAFALGVAARHGRAGALLPRRAARGAPLTPPLTRVFARLARVTAGAPAGRRATQQPVHLRLAPSIALTVAVTSAPPGTRRARDVRGEPAARRTERVDRIERTRRELVERVLARTVRHEHVHLPAPQPGGAPVPPVARVLRAPPPTPAADRGPEQPPRTRPTPPAPRAPLSSGEVSQLTESVIRSIDRRLSAARERRGLG